MSQVPPYMHAPWTLSLQDALAQSAGADAQVRAWAHLPSMERGDGAPVGALAGVAFGVKDVIDVAGMPTRSGSPATNELPRELDAACVALLRQAGGVPIGKTVTAEFAYVSPGPTRNPHHLDYTPGGSSSGSAAAVAAGMVELALGTQTGGSIIRPAAYCGVVGFKPTFGRVHRQGMQVLCDSLDTIGWFTRTVAQAAATAQLLLGPEATPPTARAPRVALLPCRSLAALSPAAESALMTCVDRLRDAGAQVTEIDCASDETELLSLHGDIMLAELARGMLALFRRHSGQLTSALCGAIQQGLAIPPEYYAACQKRREVVARQWQERLADFDFIVTPSAPSEAPRGLSTTGTSVFNRIWSLLGWPCLHLPTDLTSERLPAGVQCVAPPGNDLALLHWADWIQVHLPSDATLRHD